MTWTKSYLFLFEKISHFLVLLSRWAGENAFCTFSCNPQCFSLLVEACSHFISEISLNPSNQENVRINTQHIYFYQLCAFFSSFYFKCHGTTFFCFGACKTHTTLNRNATDSNCNATGRQKLFLGSVLNWEQLIWSPAFPSYLIRQIFPSGCKRALSWFLGYAGAPAWSPEQITQNSRVILLTRESWYLISIKRLTDSSLLAPVS